MRTCMYCEENAHYRDRQSGHYLCPAHARVEVVAREGVPKVAPALTLRSATRADAPTIGRLAEHFWGERDIECFGLSYRVDTLEAFIACDGDHVVGILAYAAENDRLNIVMLNVLPDYQGRGAARGLLRRAHEEAIRLGLSHLVVVTSNDDLPALDLYQRWGFRITRVLTGQLIEHHGGEEAGFSGVTVRDEIQLACDLSPGR